MNFEDWKKECKRILFEESEDCEIEDLAKSNIEGVEDWEWLFNQGHTPLVAIQIQKEENNII